MTVNSVVIIHGEGSGSKYSVIAIFSYSGAFSFTIIQKAGYNCGVSSISNYGGMSSTGFTISGSGSSLPNVKSIILLWFIIKKERTELNPFSPLFGW